MEEGRKVVEGVKDRKGRDMMQIRIYIQNIDIQTKCVK